MLDRSDVVTGIDGDVLKENAKHSVKMNKVTPFRQWQHGGSDVFSESALREAEEQFREDTGDTEIVQAVPAETVEDDEWDYKEGGGRDLSMGAICLLAITVVMSFF